MGAVVAVLRRLARVVVAMLVRVAVRWLGERLRRRGDRSEPDPARQGGTVIDVEPRGWFDRFSDPARQVVAHAGDTADELGDATLRTPHLLLALGELESRPARILTGWGLDVPGLRVALRRPHTQPGAGGAGARVSPGAGRALRAARDLARRGGRFAVEPIDLLTTLVDEPDEDLVAALAAVDAAPISDLRARLDRDAAS